MLLLYWGIKVWKVFITLLIDQNEEAWHDPRNF